MARSSADGTAAAVAAVLAPHAWREFTDRMLARRVVAAVDRYVVLDFLHDLPGTVIGYVDPVEPVEDDDPRVDVLIRRLAGRQWCRWSVARLCSAVTSTLEAWHQARDSDDPDLQRRLEGH